MTHRFVAYIDESGDEGFQFVPLPARKSSEWFMLSAAVCSALNEQSLTNLLPIGKSFHFRRQQHHECIRFAEKIACSAITAMTVFVHKPSMPDKSALRSKPHYLFNYATKLLVERISWFCWRRQDRGMVKLIFSQRRQLKLEHIVGYLGLIKNSSLITTSLTNLPDPRNSIEWQAISLDMIDQRPHDSLPGLVIADAVVSGSARALEWSPSHTTEHRYIKIMSSRFYRHNSRAISYGVKFVPDNLPDDDPFGPNRFHWLHHFK